MTWAEPIPLRPDSDDAAPHIVEMMGAVELDLDLDVDAVRLLVSQARLAHRRCLNAWLRENEPEYMAPPARGPYAKWERRRRKNPGRFRDGSDLAKAPLASIYFLVNSWWRRELGLPFWCDFRGWHVGDEYEGRERLEFINGPALFFVLIAQSVDFFNYTAERCKRVHDTHYRLVDRRIP
jgi:hypothetical protein